MRSWKALLLPALVLATLFAPAMASADTNDFVVTSFDSHETLTRDDPQGELHIVEKIQVVFNDNNHGILRALPQRYNGDSLQLHINSVTSTSGAPSSYTSYSQNGNKVLKIGDANSTVTGAQEYTIDYTVRNVINFYQDHDELYWNINGTQWQQQFQNVSVTLELPNELAQSAEPLCYAGAQGQSLQGCTIKRYAHSVVAATTQPLLAEQTLTTVAGFKTGYFTPPTWRDKLGEYIKPLLELLVPFLILSVGSFVAWLRAGRDPKGRGVIIPQYDSPDNLKPLAAATILHFKAEGRDITATIIDLAIRKYIKIIETKHAKALRKDIVTYSLELTRDRLDELDKHEHAIINALFDQQIVIGRQVDLSKPKTNFAATAKTVQKNVTKELTKAGYFRSNPLDSGSKLYVPFGVAVFLLIFMAHVIGIWGCIGLGAGALVTFFFAQQMAARTAQGVAAKEHLLGLKLYLNVAEKDRINKLQSPNAPYAAQSAEPVKTVELFEKLLPYAMVLGVEKQWAEQFKDLYLTPPDWYGGNWTTFNAVYLASSLNSGIGAAVGTAFAPPSSSTSSGFGGGGFSGGGGGGGGGGGW